MPEIIKGLNSVIRGYRITEVRPTNVTLTPVDRQTIVNIPEMVRLKGGTFLMGSEFKFKEPSRKVTLTDFAIGKYPVTNFEYNDFLRIMGKSIPDSVKDGIYLCHPVINISWYDGMEYCKFISDITGRNFGLPTEEQREFAARGEEGRIYPWGNEPWEGRVNFRNKGTTPVDAYPSGATPTGIFDMSGNALEWCADNEGDNLVNLEAPSSDANKVLRGGSWNGYDADGLLAAHRMYGVPNRRGGRRGFRVAERL